MQTLDAGIAPVDRAVVAPPLLMRNDYPKAVHSALLLTMGVEGARRFWSRVPLFRDGRQLTLSQLAEHVWAERATSPIDWGFSVVNAVEPYLLEHGVDYASFADNTRRFANRGSYIQTRYLLAWLGPILVPMFRFGDPYRLLLQGARLVATKMSPGVDFRIVPWRGTASSVDERLNGSLWTSYPGLGDRLPAWDFGIQPGLEMLASPRIFGLPPFESLVTVCDARTPEQVLWGSRCERRGDRLIIDGCTGGCLLPLREFLSAAGYELSGLQDRQVAVVDRDYRCEQRGRVVLSAGCAYGAPGYLVRLYWLLARPPIKNFLWFAHAEIEDDADALQASARELHRLYLAAVAETIRVVYFPSDPSIEIGGRHVCSGVPARLLYECVRIASSEGRYEFSFREFKRLPDLFSHPKNTGFEIRLKRLRSALIAANAGLTIESAGRGRFALVAGGRLSLDEHRGEPAPISS